MRSLPLAVFLLLLAVVSAVVAAEEEEESPPKQSWWSGFKTRVKNVLSKWKEDMKLLWDDVLAKADDMKGWTSELFDSFKTKLKEWLETRAEVPDDEKNEIETFISKLKVPTEKPAEKSKNIDP